MKQYIKPAVIVVKVESAKMLASSPTGLNEYDSAPQLSRETLWQEEDEDFEIGGTRAFE